MENVDSMFLSAALQSGLLEVQLGELTQKLASSPEVKSFGKSMTIDHGKANQELRALATKLNLPHAAALNAKSQAKLDSLSGLKGATFDEAYSVVMIKDHRDAIEAFSEEGTMGNDKELVTWANAKIPTLKHHLMMAEKMHNSVDQTPGRHA